MDVFHDFDSNNALLYIIVYDSCDGHLFACFLLNV